MSKLQDLKTCSMMSLRNLLDMLQDDQTLPEPRRREMMSAVRTIAKVLKREPHLIPAAPHQLRDLLNRALPTAVGVSSTRFRNAKSLLRKTLALYNSSIMPACSRAALHSGWAVLLEQPAAKPVAARHLPLLQILQRGGHSTGRGDAGRVRSVL